MQRNSKYTAAIILGVIGISISVIVSLFFVIQYIPIYIMISDSEFITVKPQYWIKLAIIFIFPLLGGIQATVGLFYKKNHVLRRSLNVVTASMGILTSQITTSMNYFWEGFYFTSNHRLFSIILAIGTLVALFCFLGSGLLLIHSENLELPHIEIEKYGGEFFVGICAILGLICTSCIAAGIYREKQPSVSNFLTFAELNFLGILGFVTFLGIFVTIYGIFLLRKKPIIGIIVILLGSIWLQVYQNAFVLGFWDPQGYMNYIEYMTLIEILSLFHLVFIVVGIGSILYNKWRVQTDKWVPRLLFFYGVFEVSVIGITLLYVFG